MKDNQSSKPWAYDPAPDMTAHIQFADLGSLPHLRGVKVVRLEVAQDLERELRYCRKLIAILLNNSHHCSRVTYVGSDPSAWDQAEAYLKATEGE